MNTVSPRATEAYFLRMLLLHVHGCTSHADIRRVVDSDGTTHVCPTYRDACVQRGLLADDTEWFACMDEAMLLQTNYTKILELVAILCIWCNLGQPRAFWDHYKPMLLESVRYRYPSLATAPEAEVENELLHELQREFTTHSPPHRLSEFDIPSPTGDDTPPPSRGRHASTLPTFTPPNPPPADTELGQQLHRLPYDIRASVLRYDAEALRARSEQMERAMQDNNPPQYRIYEIILKDILTEDSAAPRTRAHFIDAPAGTGKAFLMSNLGTG